MHIAEKLIRNNHNDEADREKVDNLREDMKPKIHVRVHYQR